jgi:hypothetical protein
VEAHYNDIKGRDPWIIYVNYPLCIRKVINCFHYYGQKLQVYSVSIDPYLHVYRQLFVLFHDYTSRSCLLIPVIPYILFDFDVSNFMCYIVFF